MHTTNETRAYSAKSRPASTTNGKKPITQAGRSASGSRHRRFGMSVGEAIRIAQISDSIEAEMESMGLKIHDRKFTASLYEVVSGLMKGIITAKDFEAAR